MYPYKECFLIRNVYVIIIGNILYKECLYYHYKETFLLQEHSAIIDQTGLMMMYWLKMMMYWLKYPSEFFFLFKVV